MYKSREKGIIDPHIPTTEALTVINSRSTLFHLSVPPLPHGRLSFCHINSH